jgi:hypothetical protein
MTKLLFNSSLFVGLAVLVSAPPPLYADRGCPGTITNGTVACHLMICGGCRHAWYSCDDGWDYDWSVCSL